MGGKLSALYAARRISGRESLNFGYAHLVEVVLSIAHLPKMLLVTAMNLLPLLLLVLLPRLVLFFGFLWPLCGFSLIALYDLKVIEKIFAILESGTQEPAGQN